MSDMFQKVTRSVSLWILHLRFAERLHVINTGAFSCMQ